MAISFPSTDVCRKSMISRMTFCSAQPAILETILQKSKARVGKKSGAKGILRGISTVWASIARAVPFS